MTRVLRGLLVGLGRGLTLASAAGAQDAPPRRQGFWFHLGLGYGTADFNCDNCGTTSREGGLAGTAAVGGTLSPQLLLGVESDGWYKDESGIKVSYGSLNAVAYYYPMRSGGLFLKAGGGLATYRFSNDGSVDDTGLGLLGGVGVDVPISRSVSLTPTVTFNAAMMGDNQGAQGVTINWLTLGASVTMH